jgi:hypothetical protein
VRHNTQALAELDRIGPPPYADDRSNAIVRKWTTAFGGAFHARLNYSKLAWVSAASPEKNWRDLARIARTDHFVAPMYPEMAGLAFDKANAKFAAIDRIAVQPAQLAAYESGGLEIYELREDARKRLGPRFQLAKFHRRVLERGVVILSDLDQYVRQWDGR